MPDENFEMWRDVAAGQQRQRTEKRLENIEQLLAKQQENIVAKCPYCDGDLSKIGIEVCKHCGKELLWYESIVYKEGELDQAKIKYDAFICATARRHDRCNELTEEIQRLKAIVYECNNKIIIGIIALAAGVVACVVCVSSLAGGFGLLCLSAGLIVFFGFILAGIDYTKKNNGINANDRIKAAEEELSRL